MDTHVVGTDRSFVRPLGVLSWAKSVVRAMGIGLSLLLVAGCTTTTPNPLSSDTRYGVYVDSVEVSWSVDDEAKAASNEDYAAGKATLIELLQARVSEEFRNSPSGSEAVRFDVDVATYHRVGAAFGNIIGGSNGVSASVSVVRLSDDTVLGVYSATGNYASNAGIIGAIAQSIIQPDIEGIMANDFAEKLRRNFDRQ